MSVSAGIAVLAAVTALAAAARSTWSPCGLSMLSTITPLAEASRGRRFRCDRRPGSWSARWWAGRRWARAPRCSPRWSAPSTCRPVSCSASPRWPPHWPSPADAGLGGLRTPGHIRQVNEDWLERYRSWVYGAGFGWQIGVGLATYIMTAAVYLTVVLAALTGRPLVALAIGCLFGLARGLAILLGARITSPAALVAFHRRFDALGEPVRRAVIVVQGGVALCAASAALGAGPLLPAPVLVAALVVAARAGAAGRGRRRRAAEAQTSGSSAVTPAA